MSLIFETDDEILIALANAYWARDEEGGYVSSVADIAASFHIRSHEVSRKVKESAVLLDKAVRCVQCGAGRQVRTRSEMSARVRGALVCHDCLVEQAEKARMDEQTRTESRTRTISQSYRDAATDLISPDQLPFRLALFLSAIVRAGGSEDCKLVSPIRSLPDRLSPTDEFDFEITESLSSDGLIQVHESSSEASVVIKEGRLASYYPLLVSWRLPFPPTDCPAWINQLEDSLRNPPPAWLDDLDEMFRELALQECLQYLRYAMSEHGFEYKFGPKTRLVLLESLDSFSIGQTASFIWRAAKDAASFLVRKNVPKQHAANTVPNKIRSTVERTLAEKWEVKSFSRNYHLPQSHISNVFFNVVLGLGESYLSQVPPSRGSDPFDEIPGV